MCSTLPPQISGCQFTIDELPHRSVDGTIGRPIGRRIGRTIGPPIDGTHVWFVVGQELNVSCLPPQERCLRHTEDVIENTILRGAKAAAARERIDAEMIDDVDVTATVAKLMKPLQAHANGDLSWRLKRGLKRRRRRRRRRRKRRRPSHDIPSKVTYGCLFVGIMKLDVAKAPMASVPERSRYAIMWRRYLYYSIGCLRPNQQRTDG